MLLLILQAQVLTSSSQLQMPEDWFTDLSQGTSKKLVLLDKTQKGHIAIATQNIFIFKQNKMDLFDDFSQDFRKEKK